MNRQADSKINRRTGSDIIINLLHRLSGWFPGKWANIFSITEWVAVIGPFHLWVSLEGEQITWKNVKIKVNELEGPPEDNDLCQGERIVSLQSWKLLHSSGRQIRTDKRTKVLYSSAHISQLWRISLITLDASCTVSSQPRASTLNQNSSVNIHDSTSKHKVLITPTWEWPLSICKSFKWRNLPREWYRDLRNALAGSWSFLAKSYLSDYNKSLQPQCLALFTCLWLVEPHMELPSAGKVACRIGGVPLGQFIYWRKEKNKEEELCGLQCALSMRFIAMSTPKS